MPSLFRLSDHLSQVSSSCRLPSQNFLRRLTVLTGRCAVIPRWKENMREEKDRCLTYRTCRIAPACMPRMSHSHPCLKRDSSLSTIQPKPSILPFPSKVTPWTAIYSGRDEKIGKKDQQDDLGSEVEREALWKKIGFAWHLKTGWWFREEVLVLRYSVV